jgi:hypothetical protein
VSRARKSCKLGRALDRGLPICEIACTSHFCRSPIISGLVTERETTIRSVSTFTWATGAPVEQRAADYRTVFDLARRTPRNFEGSRTFPMSDAAEAMAAAEAGPRRGPTILMSYD